MIRPRSDVGLGGPADLTPGDIIMRKPRSRVLYSPAVARVICDLTLNGQSLREICARKGMPSRNTVRRWIQERPLFAETYAAALAAGGGHPRSGPAPTYSLKRAAAFCDRLARGETLKEICSDPIMPSLGGLHLWLHRHPDFAAMYQRARMVQADLLFDEVRAIADQATPQTLQVDRTRIMARQWQAAKLAPRPSTKAGAEPELPEVEVVRLAAQTDPSA